jgi:3-deoxy-D-manno-octulosonate 8-phosphate phosphatase (KDO 8-P phosphatase)
MTQEFYHIISDCDGILTSANIQCGVDGKRSKLFSVNDSLTVPFMLNTYGDKLDFVVLTGDGGTGLEVTRNRLEYMKVPFVQCKNAHKYAYIKANYNMDQVIYIGDDIYDFAIFQECAYSATVCNAPAIIKKYAKYVSPYEGGKNALTDILFHIMDKLRLDYETALTNIIHNNHKNNNANK